MILLKRLVIHQPFFILAGMMSSRLLLLLFVMVFGLQVEGQNKLTRLFFPPVDSVINDYDTSYIDPLLDQVTFRVYGGYKPNEFRIKDQYQDPKVYASNSKFQLGIGFGYRWLILNSAIVAPFKNKYNQDRGKSFAFDSQVNVYAPKFQTDLRFQWIDGYYQKTADEVFSNFKNQGPYTLRNDMKLRSFGAGIYHSFNEKYSHKHAFDQTKLMKKSGGTLLMGVRGGYLHLSSDSAMFEHKSVLVDSILDIKSFTMSAAFGGAYTQLLGKNWFATVHGAIYLTGQNVVLEGSNGFISTLSNEANLVISPTVRIGFGYNTKKHFIGFYGVFDSSPDNAFNGDRVDYYYSSMKLIYAFRIPVSKFQR